MKMLGNRARKINLCSHLRLTKTLNNNSLLCLPNRSEKLQKIEDQVLSVLLRRQRILKTTVTFKILATILICKIQKTAKYELDL